ncbi:MAG: HTTM domain-containing protein, partial [Leptospiraceae bacterium]|nr:HTTM domain-containing protein [Leptospiraceae bacterium]
IAANTIFLSPPPLFVDSGIGKKVSAFWSRPSAKAPKDARPYAASGTFLLFLLAFFVFQLFFPARRFLYPGPTIWNEYGFRFSWQVMVMQKSGLCEFSVLSDKHRFLVHPSEILTPYQELMMSTQPDMILQFGRHLAERYGENGPARVYAHCLVSLNGRRHQPFIRADVNLADPGTDERDLVIPLRLH